MRFWIILALLGNMLSAIEIGIPMPPLKGEFLSGRAAVLPAASAGRTALVAMGFTYKSRFPVEAWTKRLSSEFGKNPGVTFFEVPMIGGMAVMGKWFINSGMRRGTPKEDYEHVITVYSGVGEWKKRTDYRAPDAAYLLLLDPKGNVIWKFTGDFDEAAFGQLKARLP